MNTEQTDTTELDNAWALLESQAAVVDNEISPEIINESSAAVEEIHTAELLAPVIKITGDILAPNWGLNESECEQLAAAYGGLIDKYMPDNDLTKYGVEITALMTTAIIFGSRRGVPLKQEDVKEKVKEEVRGEEVKSGVLVAKAVAND